MPRSKSKWGTVIALILAPLVVSVVGGLLVEWLKARENKPENDATPVVAQEQGRDTPRTNNNVGKAAIYGKWWADDGEQTLEFFRSGKVVSSQNGKEHGAITFTGEGEQIRIPADNSGSSPGEVISLTQEELVIHWQGRDATIRYRRNPPSKVWYFGKIFLSIVLVGGYLVVFGFAAQKKSTMSLEDRFGAGCGFFVGGLVLMWVVARMWA